MPLYLVHEDSKQAPNGVRVLYDVSSPYVAGSVRVFRNGQLEIKRFSGSGFTEVPPKRIRFNTAPETGDHITFQYRVSV